MVLLGDAVRSADLEPCCRSLCTTLSKTCRLNIYAVNSLFLPVWANGSLEMR